jgi:hypothetical protein
MSKTFVVIDLRSSLASSADLAGDEAEYVFSTFGHSDGRHININDMLVSDEFWNEQLIFTRQVDAFFEERTAKSPALASVIKGCKVALWDHNLLEAHKWIATLEKTFAGRDLSDVEVRLPRAATRNQIYLYEAEGETSGSWIGRLLYRRTDFLLDFIRQWFAAHGVKSFQAYDVERDPMGLWLRRAIRVWAVLAHSLLSHILGSIRHHLRECAPPQAREAVANSRIVALTRSSVHSDYLAPAVRQGDVGILVADNFRTYPRNLHSSRGFFGNAPMVHLYDLIGIRDLLAAAFVTVRSLIQLRREARPDVCDDLEIHGVRISLQQYYRESAVQCFEALLVQRGLEHLIGETPKTIIHCEMFTHHAVCLADRFGSNGRVHQVAFGTYEMRPTPNFVFGDGMLCFSQDQQASMLAIGADPSSVLYKGNIHVSDSDMNVDVQIAERRLNCRKIAYYTQPYLQDIEHALLEEISALCMAKGYQLTVILHPRDTRGRFEFLEDRSEIVENTEYISRRQEIEDSILFACTRTSNVGYFLILRGVPIINIMPTAQDRLIRQEYFEGYPLVGHSAEFLITIFSDPKSALEDFYAFRSQFIHRSYRGLGVKSLLSFLQNELTD